MPRVLAALLLPSIAAMAQSVVVPSAAANTVGTGQLNTIVREAGNPRSYQYGINASQLTGIPAGSVLTGVSLRFSPSPLNPPIWPAADITWSNYWIVAGPVLPPVLWGADPQANFAGTPTLVRSGPLVLDAGAFTNQAAPGTPNPWSEFYFDFQTVYPYGGGDLGLLFSHPGSDDPLLARYPETVASDASAHGAARSQGAFPPGPGSLPAPFYVMRIHYGFGTGCPGSNGLPPVLVLNGKVNTAQGGTIRLQIANAPAAAPVLFAGGYVLGSMPLVPGCTLLTAPGATAAGFTDGRGRAVLELPVPPGLAGSFFAQGIVLDSGAPHGLTVTNAVHPQAN